MRRWLYQIVLREAGSPEDLTAYLDGDTLIALLARPVPAPRGVRQAWEGGSTRSCGPGLTASPSDAGQRVPRPGGRHPPLRAGPLRTGSALGRAATPLNRPNGVIDRFTQDVGRLQ